MITRSNQRISPLFILVELALLFTLSCRAGEILSLTGQYHFRSWTAENGLPQNTVRFLLQTKNGYLWIATRAGLARFDGLHFTIFNKVTAPQMANDNCVALAESTNGLVWIGTENGLLRWKDHQLTPFQLGSETGAARNIRCLSAGPRNALWVATFDGLFQVVGNRVHRFTTDDGLQSNNIRAVMEDFAGNVWVGTEVSQYSGGLQKLERGRKKFETIPGRAMVDLTNMVHCFFLDEAGTVWWGNNQGLHGLRNSNGFDYSMTNGLAGQVIRRLALGLGNSAIITVDDRAEFRGRRAVQRLDHGQIQTIALVPEKAQMDIGCSIEGREGNIWIGTKSEGLICLSPTLFRSFNAQDGLSDDSVNSICELENGTILAATAANLSIIKSNSITKKAWVPGPVQVLSKDRLGHIWLAGGDPPSLETFLQCSANPPGDFLHSSMTNGLVMEMRKNPVNCFGVDSEDWLWLGQPNGVVRFRPRSRLSFEGHRFTTADGLSANDIRAVVADRSGSVWIGTFGGGLNRWRSGQFTIFRVIHGLPSDFVGALYVDSNDALWIGTDQGLARLKDNRISRITAGEGLLTDPIHQIIEDDFGYFWLGCNHGLLHIRRSDLEAVADGRTARIQPVLFGEADGLPSSEIRSFQPGACKASDGRLWFPTLKGAAVVDPKHLHLNEVAPLGVIEKVIANRQTVYGDESNVDALGSRIGTEPTGERPDRSLSDGAVTRLSSGQGRVIEIHYTANTFAAPAKVRFQFKLVGYDSDWRWDDQNLRVAFYTNLRPGNYRFLVKACNNHGYWNERPVAFDFYLAPYFYQTSSFYLACTFAAVAAAFALHHSRIRGLEKVQQLQREHALELERARIARDIHDDLGSRLSQLAVLGELADRNLDTPAAASPHINKLRQTTNEIFEALDETVWAVNPKQDSLAGLASYLREYASAFLSPAGVHCRISFPNPIPERSLSAEVRHHLFLVIKEALNNIVKHAQATEVRLKMTLERELIELLIQDNGCGLAEATPNHSPSAGNGNGLLNMRLRIERLGGRFEVFSQPGQGTTIRLTVSHLRQSRRLVNGEPLKAD